MLLLNGTFAFAPPLQANPSAKSKEPFLVFTSLTITLNKRNQIKYK